jgi:hypothetical protein
MLIHFQLTAMASKGTREGQGKATGSAKLLTSVINRRLVLDQDSITGFISELIGGPLQK